MRVTGVAFTPDGKDLVSICQDRTIRLWDVAAGKEKKQIGTTEDDLYGIAFSRDGKAMATSGYAGWLKVWPLDGTKVNDKPSFSQKLKAFGAYCVVFSPDGKSLVTGHDNRSIYITPIGK